MTISRVKPGNWVGAEELTAAQIDDVDDNFTYSVDTRSGQTDTISSTVAWTTGGITTSSGVDISVSSTATVSASSGEINLYGSAGSLTNSKFPLIAGDTVEFTVFLSVADCNPSCGGSIGQERLWTYTSNGTSPPYMSLEGIASTYDATLMWKLPKIHGATVKSVSAWLTGTATEDVTSSTQKPSIEVLKTTRSSGAVVSLKSGTSAVEDASTTAASYNTRHAITLTADQNHTSMSLANGDDYSVRFNTPTQGTAVYFNVFGISVTYQVTRFAPAL